MSTAQPPVKLFFKTLKTAGYASKEQRELLIAGWTDNRTDSTTGLTTKEMWEIINHLAVRNTPGQPPAYTTPQSQKTMQAKALKLATEVGLLQPVPRGERPDYAKLNGWMVAKSVHHKLLFKYTENELPALLDQLEAWAKRARLAEGSVAPTDAMP